LLIKSQLFAFVLSVLAVCQIPALAAERSATAIMRVSVTVPDTCSASVNQAANVREGLPVSVACNAATPYHVSVSKKQADGVAAVHTVQYSSLKDAAQPDNTETSPILISITY
jgi:hypothetical protein